MLSNLVHNRAADHDRFGLLRHEFCLVRIGNAKTDRNRQFRVATYFPYISAIVSDTLACMPVTPSRET